MNCDNKVKRTVPDGNLRVFATWCGPTNQLPSFINLDDIDLEVCGGDLTCTITAFNEPYMVGTNATLQVTWRCGRCGWTDWPELPNETNVSYFVTAWARNFILDPTPMREKWRQDQAEKERKSEAFIAARKEWYAHGPD